MKFEEVLPALRAGKKIQQTKDREVYYAIDNNCIECYNVENNCASAFCFLHDQILDDDWEILE